MLLSTADSTELLKQAVQNSASPLAFVNNLLDKNLSIELRRDLETIQKHIAKKEDEKKESLNNQALAFAYYEYIVSVLLHDAQTKELAQRAYYEPVAKPSDGLIQVKEDIILKEEHALIAQPVPVKKAVEDVQKQIIAFVANAINKAMAPLRPIIQQAAQTAVQNVTSALSPQQLQSMAAAATAMLQQPLPSALVGTPAALLAPQLTPTPAPTAKPKTAEEQTNEYMCSYVQKIVEMSIVNNRVVLMAASNCAPHAFASSIEAKFYECILGMHSHYSKAASLNADVETFYTESIRRTAHGLAIAPELGQLLFNNTCKELNMACNLLPKSFIQGYGYQQHPFCGCGISPFAFEPTPDKQ